MSVICKRAIVTGRVQGVGFRANTFRQAQKIGGLAGWVRNLPDGSVEIVAQGGARNVAELLTWAKTGPSASRVLGLTEEASPVDPNLGSFTVR